MVDLSVCRPEQIILLTLLHMLHLIVLKFNASVFYQCLQKFKNVFAKGFYCFCQHNYNCMSRTVITGLVAP